MKKRILALLAATILMTSMVGCSEDKTTEKDISNEINKVEDYIEKSADENSKANIGAYSTPSEDDFLWNTIDGGVEISDYTGSITAVEIPSELGGKNVVAIGTNAFSQSNVVGIKIPDTVELIDEKAFLYAMNLVEVHFGSNVKKVGLSAFEGCSALTTVKLNETLEEIGVQAFCWTTSLKEVNMPALVKVLDGGAFCLSGLEKITIPANVMINDQVFRNCEYLKEVIIEDGVTTIGSGAFDNCTSLEKVEIPASVKEVGSRAFDRCEKLTIYAPKGSEAEKYANENSVKFEAQ